MNQDLRDRFAALHVPGDPVLLYNIWDVGSAVAVAKGGAPALSTGSHSLAEAQGYPDGEGIPLKVLLETVRRIVAAVDIPVDVRGTAFQERVWQELRRIPPGETRAYAEIAAAAGNPRAVRAAGSANGANHVPVLIPCHCVVRSDGSLGGYAYGLDIKRKLLEREGAK